MGASYTIGTLVGIPVERSASATCGEKTKTGTETEVRDFYTSFTRVGNYRYSMVHLQHAQFHALSTRTGSSDVKL